jgi:hypothetical protein
MAAGGLLDFAVLELNYVKNMVEVPPPVKEAASKEAA